MIGAKHKAISEYYRTLDELQTQQDVTHEGGLRRAFSELLSSTAKKYNWVLVEESSFRVKRGGQSVRPDGTLRDQWQLPRGHWEAKDGDDDLGAEIRHKRARGYPFTNILFEDTQEVVLYQDESYVKRTSVRDKAGLADLLTTFYSHKSAAFTDFDEAVERFQNEVPSIASGLKERIDEAHRENHEFQKVFAEFEELCRKALNPNISRAAIDEMLIQHLLTERIIRKVFDHEDFTRRNAIAMEVEKVIDSLTSEYFDKGKFFGALDQFYIAIERTADRLANFQEKQHFINTVYERFFQGYSVRVADTHGIVYTPQEIVDFMCAAVEQVLRDEFGQQLGDEGVVVIDPCTGTGNFVTHLLRRAHAANPRAFERFYEEQLFANEVMLMPYYIASLNIEHEYRDLTGRYKPFDGLCFVDTLDLAKQIVDTAEGKMETLTLRGEFSQKNAERVERQQQAKITVILGNPPYNAGQQNENDNNKNRKYKQIDRRVKDTYKKDSKAQLQRKLNDPYVSFFRWATDRLERRDGIVCFVSNNSFVDGISFDGMRQHLLQDFTRIYHLDLHGNVRQNPSLSGTSHNVFGIQVGVGITIAVNSSAHQNNKLQFYRAPELWRKEEKLRWLVDRVALGGTENTLSKVEWRRLEPDARHSWLLSEHSAEFASFLPIGTSKRAASRVKGRNALYEPETLFKVFSTGLSTNRDAVVYDFDHRRLESRVVNFIEDYNAEVDRYKRHGKPENIDDFVNYENIKWSRNLKREMKRGNYAVHDPDKVRSSTYRPFTKKHLFFDPILIDEIGQFMRIFPLSHMETGNLAICVSGVGSNKPFHSMVSNTLSSLDLLEKTQCFPLYSYDRGGNQRKENITDWAQAQVRKRYDDNTIGKHDIFYYVYGLLHHPEYCERYADNLRLELPRIPFAPDFWVFSKAGRQLATLHLGYEQAEPYPLEWEASGAIDYRVEKMHPGKKSPSSRGDWKIFDTVKYNDTLTLTGIPLEAFDYRLGQPLGAGMDHRSISGGYRTKQRYCPRPQRIQRRIRAISSICWRKSSPSAWRRCASSTNWRN